MGTVFGLIISVLRSSARPASGRWARKYHQKSGDNSNLCETYNNLVAQCACFGSIVQPELYIFSLRNSTTTTSTTTICFFLSYIIWECAIKFLQQNLRPMRLQKYESMLWPKKEAHIFLCDLLFGPSINYGFYLFSGLNFRI